MQKYQKLHTLQNIWDTVIQEWKKSWWLDDKDIAMSIQPRFCDIFEYYDISRFSDKCSSDTITQTRSDATKTANRDSSTKSWWLPWRLKIVLIILVWWLLVMWWVIVFFSIKAKLNSWSDDADEW